MIFKAAIYLLGSGVCFFVLFSGIPQPSAFVVFAGGVGLGIAAICQGVIAAFKLDTPKWRAVTSTIVVSGIVTAALLIAAVGWQLFVAVGDSGHGPG